MSLIPKCMSTQHPDNVNSPFFAENTELSGDDEIQEAYYAFSHLGCDEQMWDCEGKEVDNFVVKKLLTKYETYFKEHRLGQDIRLTLRVPNPTVEKAEAKILLETLESIPRSFDAAKLFYNNGDTPPIFEVIMPMVTSHKCIDRAYQYYKNFVVDKQNKPFNNHDITIAEWIGEFKPTSINVIPLFEDMEHILAGHEIVRVYLQNKNVDYQRVFLARSDPAVNYGLVSAVLLNKIALQRLHRLALELNKPIYPIIGVGSAPFRGNLRPQTAERVVAEYAGAHTFTIQSAFKYDHDPNQVASAVKILKTRTLRVPSEIDEERCIEIIRKYAQEYSKQITKLAPMINALARFVPSRRKRKLHIGLFGYSRDMQGISLPRAIPFTAALYSVGLPPELLGLNALNAADRRFLKNVYIHFDDDLNDALKYYNPHNNLLPADLATALQELQTAVQPDENHQQMTTEILHALQQNKTDGLTESITRAAHRRQFLG